MVLIVSVLLFSSEFGLFFNVLFMKFFIRFALLLWCF